MKLTRLLFALALAAACRSGDPAAPDPTLVQGEQAPDAVDGAVDPEPVTPEGPYLGVLPKDAGAPSLDAIENLSRLPELADTHRKMLADHRFFVTPQPPPKAKPKDAAAARTGRRAKHLFQVYERNDYIRFPSFVTADLAIDLTHQYFEAVLRRIEREHLYPRIQKSLVAFVREADTLHRAAKTPEGRSAALAALRYWATALRLLEQPAKGDQPDTLEVRPPWYGMEGMEDMVEPGAKTPPPPPPSITKLPRSVDRDVAKIVAKVHAAAAKQKFDDWGIELDLTQTKPRSHYAGSGTMQRYFRAMSFLGLSTFAIEGDDARLGFAAALTRSFVADASARKTFDDALSVTNFVVGEPPTSDLSRAADVLAETTKGFATAGADTLASKEVQASVATAWGSLPEHPIAQAGPVVAPMGQRVFADTFAMSAMLSLMREAEASDEPFVRRAMGALGSASVLGSDEAAAFITASAPDPAAAKVALAKGRASLPDPRDKADAYHQTLAALTTMLDAKPLYFDPDAYRVRSLQTYAGGWAMLRHDTLLYAYQMGAECDAEEQPPPYGWVEPTPQTYARLETMVSTFAKRVKEAGISDPAAGPDDWDVAFQSIETKTDAILGLLRAMKRWSDKELRGEAFTLEERTEIAMVGGLAEHVLLTLADAFELGEGNDDMAVVADVFSWKGNALEVGVAHPELIYAVIPTPEGWMLARGAVMSYREFMVPVADRMTDEAWRERVAKSEDFEAATRPRWLDSISAPPVGVVELAPKEEPQQRCGYYGGAFEI